MTRWKSRAADGEGSGGGVPSISDVFADMLNVNEDMIVAAAECQAEGEVEGLVAYQRTLHRDLMEMAEFIDSMFGVYSNSSSNGLAASSTLMQKKSDALEPRVIDLTADVDVEAPSRNVERPQEVENKLAEKPQRGALLKAIEAGEKDRIIQRSKQQWIKSRHQVLEEEGVSAIMNESTGGMLEAVSVKPGADEEQQGSGGLALANQLRAHQHIAAFMKASTESAAVAPPPAVPMNLLLANSLAIPVEAPPLTVPIPVPPAPPLPGLADAQIKLSSVGNNPPKIALPPAHSMFNMLFAFPGAPPVIFNPQAAGGLIPLSSWQPQFPAPMPARAAMPARPPAKSPKFKRMCESCRKRHFSVRQCRLVLQHTDPEWQPAQPPPAIRRRRRKQPASNTQVT